MSISEPYDVNFYYPVKELENQRVKLTPFIPSIHGEPFFEETRRHPEIYDYLSFGPFDEYSTFTNLVLNGRIQTDPGIILFAVLDKEINSSLTFAGVIGLLNTVPANLSTEIGFVITFPVFQRTHVTTNMVGLLLEWCFGLRRDGGLGLRRVQWQTNELNIKSRKAAERMGFKFEMVQRWQVVLSEGKKGVDVSTLQQDGTKGRPGRHSVILSICWDEWEVERDRIREIMGRQG
ncbi:acyl-CoA N-acyltransferase [Abortiporus biennis]|nr:acyl-CoA N-acyltransferase [Abortiporus biennis]